MGFWAFWIISVGLAALAALVLMRALLRGRIGDEAPAAYDLRVYRDQLRGVDRDLERGVLTETEAARLRTEVSRRILTADAQLQAQGPAGDQPKGPSRVLAGVLVLGLVGGAAALYMLLGAPGYGDLPLSDRLAASERMRANLPTQAELEAAQAETPQTDPQVAGDFLALMEKLREAVAGNPDDLQGLGLLARNEARLGNFAAARKAQARIVEIKGEAATGRDHALLADLMISAAGGTVSGEAEAALRAALRREPGEETALYYLGLYYLQVDRADATLRIWDGLLRTSAPDAPWLTPIRAMIPEVAARAGVRYDLPESPALPGPNADDIAAAEDMSAEDRAAFVRGMVGQLSERLASRGGTPQEWARLITALGVLGESDRARAIAQEAREVFAGNAQAIDLIDGAASQAGVAE
ncbi:c-type cytochrome biogenesis protein CcmI [Roseovarius nubinhibens]|uniref:Putative cytochrome c-type biogenesis protein, cycH n=1 Tax=Roseovarius nubinhibens (strain ATCC BAA-591 / DSM 15170 / ISM) TaxID=89187 RepID=A3SQA3_ROSNI|nr:c-type cytochrome biogenesis protein CcmI [Roseovarius nubinhibens]EAP75312.1 Putative cytochrome c-type biogenesis protein, cycH [Roseovarius nubinhibens ISM]